MSFVDEATNGARFWVPCTERVPGMPDYRGSGPFPTTPKGFTGRITFLRIIDPRSGKPTEINGEAWFTNSEQVRELIKHANGQIRFDPAEIVEKGILSPDEMASLGYVVSATPKQPAPDATPIPEAMPDFYTMSKAELREWANARGIFLDERMSKDKMVSQVKKEIEK